LGGKDCDGGIEDGSEFSDIDNDIIGTCVEITILRGLDNL
jgi:hypothetical protein